MAIEQLPLYAKNAWPHQILQQVAHEFERYAAAAIARELVDQKRGWKGRRRKMENKVERNNQTLERVREMLADADAAGIELPFPFNKE